MLRKDEEGYGRHLASPDLINPKNMNSLKITAKRNIFKRNSKCHIKRLTSKEKRISVSKSKENKNKPNSKIETYKKLNIWCNKFVFLPPELKNKTDHKNMTQVRIKKRVMSPSPVSSFSI